MGKEGFNVYKAMFEQLEAGILMTDADGIIQSSNFAYSELSGFENDEVTGKRIASLLEGTYTENEISEGEVYVKRKNKKDTPRWLYVNPVTDDAGNITSVIYLIRNFHVCGFDPLTNLPNRFLLTRHLNKAIRRAQKNSTMIAILYVDLDRFKFVNDTLGHDYGDFLLKAATERIKGALGSKNFIVRMGGDEFVCVLEGLSDEKEASMLAKAVVDSFSQSFMLKETEVFVTASVGISLFPYDGDEAEILVTNADSAMYLAKRNGKNQYKRVQAHESAGAFEKLLLENSLRKALKEDELTLYFQPQIHLKTNEMLSMEALIRWNHSELGLISPGEFIPIAEETGLIVPIGDWVLETACLKIVEWQNAGLPPVRVAVNLSAAQLLQTDFVAKIDHILKKTNVDPFFLELEITENIVMQDVHKTVTILHKLKERGVHLSIDDFGTGYSSLNYLRELPVDTVKIDRSFIKDIDKDKSSASLTKAIIALAHDLGLRVVAEGVETRQQLALIKQQSCDVVQGFYFSRPLNSDHIVQYYNEFSAVAQIN